MISNELYPQALLLLLAAPWSARAGYLHPAPLPPVVSYGYHTAVVSKPVLPLPVYPHVPHVPHVPLPVLPPPVIIKPIATSYQSFHKVTEAERYLHQIFF